MRWEEEGGHNGGPIFGTKTQFSGTFNQERDWLLSLNVALVRYAAFSGRRAYNGACRAIVIAPFSILESREIKAFGSSFRRWLLNLGCFCVWGTLPAGGAAEGSLCQSAVWSDENF